MINLIQPTLVKEGPSAMCHAINFRKYEMSETRGINTQLKCSGG